MVSAVMRYATFSLKSDSTERLGVVVAGKADTIFDVQVLLGAPAGTLPRTLPELIASGPESWGRLAARIQ